MLISNGNFSLQNYASGERKFCKATHARCDLRDFLVPNQGGERKKVVFAQATRKKRRQLATETRRFGSSSGKIGKLILTVLRGDEKRNQIERCTIKYFCRVKVWKSNLFKGYNNRVTKIGQLLTKFDKP